MKQTGLFVLGTWLFLFVSFQQAAAQQTDSTVINQDSIEQVVDDFIALLDSLKKPTSYFLAGVGFGNQQFSLRNVALNAQQQNAGSTWIPQLSYMDKSGLGLAYSNYITLSGNALQILQHTITPSYDYLKADHWTAGVSYTRFIGNKNPELGSSPYQHDFYSYFRYKKAWIEPSVSLGSSFGRFTETAQKYTFAIIKRLSRPDTLVHFRLFDTLRVKIRDFSLVLNFQHRFQWKGFTAKDAFDFQPSFLLFFARNQYDLEYSSEGKFSPRVQSLQQNNPLFFRQLQAQVQRQFPDLFQTRNVLNTAAFNLQSLGLDLNLTWMLGKFFINPRVYLDYYLLSSREKFKVFYSAQIGCMF